MNELRTSSPRDDSEWSFGQILPLILLVAPLVIALENFYTKAKNIIVETTGSPHQNEITNGPGHIRELQHVDTIAYRAALLLALLSYLEIGVYFIFTQQASDGLITPVIQIIILMVFSNPCLQFMWINFEIWMSQASWKVTSKRACYDTVLQSFVAILLTTNFPALFFNSLGDRGSLLVMILLPNSCILVLSVCGYFCFALVFAVIARFGFAKWGFIISLIFLSVPFSLPRIVPRSEYISMFAGALELHTLICTLGFLVLLLTNYGLQVWAERKHVSNWLILCLRCILAMGVNTALFISIPIGVTIISAFASSFQTCIIIFTGSRLVSQPRQSG